MSTEELERQTRNHLSNGVPQIHQHDGSFEVSDADEAAGTATVAIGGACSGCGIALMTMWGIETHLPDAVKNLDDITVVRSGGPNAAVMPSKTDATEEMGHLRGLRPAVLTPATRLF